MKKLLTAVIIFPLFFIAFSEGLAIRKSEIFNSWVTTYLVDSPTSSSDSGVIAEIEPKDIKDHIRPIGSDAAFTCRAHLVSDIEYIRDAPRSRVPVMNVIDFYGRLFATVSAAANAVVAHAGSSRYWTEKVEELNISEENAETESEFVEWCRERKKEIETLTILGEWSFGMDTPEELVDDIVCYSLDDVPFSKRIFLKNWDTYTKERALSLYSNYQQHIKEDNLAKASADLFYVYAIKKSREDVIPNLNMFFDTGVYNYRILLILECALIAVLSFAATGILLLLVFYRGSPAVLSGIPPGILTAFLSFDYFDLVLFFLAGVAAVFISNRHKIPLNYRKSAVISLKAGLVLFLVYYVVCAVFLFTGVIHTEMKDAGFLGSEFLVNMSFYAAVQVVFICVVSVVGGLLAKVIFFRNRDIL